ncbi:hypothetical protein BCR44DRAFT_196684 [Catenaria anguillulae PL171]|uniref:Uncharacterized protein n=1 Tax=Catenaria anguillulae PL171 TaxID=765915 RepID=A0A1Y2HRR2_9FUNG|nr:hypothetical protein BCR44DRAFT_196684 [Catenaria anguillulae PL171]
MSAPTTLKYIDFYFKGYQAFLDTLSDDERAGELRRTRDYHGLCPGDSFVTKLDMEAITSDPSEIPNGLQLTCSDGSPVQPINYVGPSVPAIGFYPVKRVDGNVQPLGITDMLVDYYGKGEMINRIGYGGQVIGKGTEKVWNQVQDDQVKQGCVLKGIDMWAKFPFIIGRTSVGLQFQCQNVPPPPPPVSSTSSSVPPPVSSPSPAPPPESTSSAPLPVPEPTSTPGTSTSASSTPTSFSSFLSSSPPSTPTQPTQPTPDSPAFSVPSGAPAPAPTPTTTTIFVTSGPLTTSLITVITPGQPLPPLTITVPGDGGPARTLLLTQLPGKTTYAATTILMMRDPTVGTDGDGNVVLLTAIVCALALVAGALVVAVVALKRQERNKRHSGMSEQLGVAAVEMVAMGPESRVGVPPGLPAYVVVPVATAARSGKVRGGVDGS